MGPCRGRERSLGASPGGWCSGCGASTTSWRPATCRASGPGWTAGEAVAVILTQHYLACISHASYPIGDETTRRAVVVDPRRDIGDWRE